MTSVKDPSVKRDRAQCRPGRTPTIDSCRAASLAESPTTIGLRKPETPHTAAKWPQSFPRERFRAEAKHMAIRVYDLTFT